MSLSQIFLQRFKIFGYLLVFKYITRLITLQLDVNETWFCDSLTTYGAVSMTDKYLLAPNNKRLGYRRETRDAPYQLKFWPTVVQITKTDRVLAWGALLAIFIRLPAMFCTCIVAVGSAIALRACDAPCHVHVTLKWPCVSSTDFHTTNILDVNETVTVIHQLRLPPCWWHRIFFRQRTVADGYKFSALRRLNRRLLDRSKNAIGDTIMAPPLGVIPSEFCRDLLRRKTKIPGYRMALFLRS